MRLWICEKPSQAKDVAAVLGSARRGDGYWETAQGRVVWCFGHLLEQAQPDAYDAAHKTWSVAALPIVPETWQLVPIRKVAAQLKVVGTALRAASEVVIATDADREGEAIARELLERFRYRGPVKRLWLRALEASAVRAAIADMREGSSTEPLYWASQARSRADWLVGMNLTRAATKIGEVLGAERGVRSVGRVQTPTLALVVRRDRLIFGFESRAYYELAATVDAAGESVLLRHAPSATPEDKRIYERETAVALAAQAQDAQGPLGVATARKRQGPGKLYSLSGLQKACNRRYGWSADKTLRVAQSLYETHKLTTYPRTDCTFLADEHVATVPALLSAVGALPELSAHSAHAAAAPIIRKSIFNGAKVTAHHAIIPTGLKPTATLDADARKAYALIAQRFVAALLPDHEYDETRITMDANGVPFGAVGRTPVVAGWRSVYGAGTDEEQDEADTSTQLPGLADGTPSAVRHVEVEGKKTSPPDRYTEGTLIEDMCSVAKYATDPDVRARLKEQSGIGTEATRAAIIKTLRDRGFLEARGKWIESTPSGRGLIDFLPADLCDAALTAVWEDHLERIGSGEVPMSARDEFVSGIEQYVATLLAQLKARVPDGVVVDGPPNAPSARPPSAKQLAHAEDLAHRAGLREVPERARTSAAECSQFITERSGGASNGATDSPTPNQKSLLERLERERGVSVPDEARTSRKACSQYLDTLLGERSAVGRSRRPTRR